MSNRFSYSGLLLFDLFGPLFLSYFCALPFIPETAAPDDLDALLRAVADFTAPIIHVVDDLDGLF